MFSLKTLMRKLEMKNWQTASKLRRAEGFSFVRIMITMTFRRRRVRVRRRNRIREQEIKQIFPQDN